MYYGKVTELYFIILGTQHKSKALKTIQKYEKLIFCYISGNKFPVIYLVKLVTIVVEVIFIGVCLTDISIAERGVPEINYDDKCVSSCTSKIQIEVYK